MNKNNVKICSDSKELNPITGNCNKKCVKGKIRDANFKCVNIIKGKPGRKPNKLPAKKITPQKRSLSPHDKDAKSDKDKSVKVWDSVSYKLL